MLGIPELQVHVLECDSRPLVPCRKRRATRANRSRPLATGVARPLPDVATAVAALAEAMRRAGDEGRADLRQLVENLLGEPAPVVDLAVAAVGVAAK